MRFSLIIPSYNNAQELSRELPGLIDFLHGQNLDPEVIIVNDGSGETSLLEQFCSEKSFTLLHHKKNIGKGAAVCSGMMAANCDIRIFTDADIPFQYDIFPEIIKMFEEARVQMVCGDRRQSDYFLKTPPIRRLGSSIFSMLVNIIMFRNLGDTQCGIKAFRSEAALNIFPRSRITGFAADIEWLFLAHKSAIQVHWVKAEFRNAGESSVVFWKQALRMLWDVVKLRMRVSFRG